MSRNGWDLYRVDWEEQSVDDSTVYIKACAFVPSQEPINTAEWGDGVDVVRDVTARIATDEEEEAYQAGFEDGFDVATMQHRLQQMKDSGDPRFINLDLQTGEIIPEAEPEVTRDDEMLSLFDVHGENCKCNGVCGCN
jgi:hypothetical protein